MHSSQSRNRRSRGNNFDDDEEGVKARHESSAGGYDRSRHYPQSNDSYRAGGPSARASYSREPSSSHPHDDWRQPDPSFSSHDSYSYSHSNDPYKRTSRDEYDAPDPRASDVWVGRPAIETPYAAEDRGWTARYDRAPVVSHPEPPAPWAPGSYDDRGANYDDWREENRGGPSLERTQVRSEYDDRRGDTDKVGWGKNARKDPRKEAGKDDRKGGNPLTWLSDAGWDSRRSEPRGQPPLEPSTKHAYEREDTQPPPSDRAWEPAPTWQLNKRNNVGSNQGNHKTSRNQQFSKNAKGAKKNQPMSKQKRDWRTDDGGAGAGGNLNNWSKRDTQDNSPYNSRTTKKRRQPRSPSRSRSRSPADSYDSRRSSRGRSRSRSAPPKRRRRSGSRDRVRTPSASPNARGRTGYGPLKRRARSRSPPSSIHSRDSRKLLRKRSFSSASSFSRSRSSTRSPTGDSRPKHRLPPATSLQDIKAPVINVTTTRAPLMYPPRDTDSHRNNWQANGNHTNSSQPAQPTTHTQSRRSPVASRDPPLRYDRSEEYSSARLISNKRSQRSPVPPRASPRPTYGQISSGDTPPLHTPYYKADTRNIYKAQSSHGPDDEQPPPNGNHPAVLKNAGFKPIGQASSAVKRFFPSLDEDSAETLPNSVTLPTHAIVPQAADLQISGIARNGRRFSQSDSIYRQSREHQASPKINRHSGYGDISISPEYRHTHDQSHHRRSPTPERIPQLRHPSQSHRLSVTPERVSQPVSPVQVHDDNVQQSDPRRMTSHDRELPLEKNEVGLSRQSSLPPDGSRGDLYAIIAQVGEGTFGKVYKARNTVTKVHVALKRIRMESEKDGFPVTAMREIKLLQSLRHRNIVRLYEMMVSNGSVYMVFEYSDHDLTGILSQTQFSFTPAHLKSLCHQMLAGLAYLHHKSVIHRDIKGSNILISSRGELKLADFGLARFYQKRRRSDYTNRVITLWYRPPELLFGATVYGPEVDMWSAGCIMLELFTKRPVFQGNDEIHQLDVIFKVLGTPLLERWPGMASLPWYELVKPKEVIPDQLRALFHKWLSPAGLDLAERLLAYDPTQRITALDAMDAPYFKQEDPPAALPTGLSTLEGEWHELETKRERAKKRRKTEPNLP